MSVCFFVPAATEGTNSSANDGDNEVSVSVVEDGSSHDQWSGDSGIQQLQQFWSNVFSDIKKVQPDHFKSQALPLARIKKIMKLDEEVKMISAEAPVLFAKAAEIFIHELTLRAWAHTEDNKRRTLQKNDIAMAISKSDQFDFLIDIVPRHEVKTTKVRDDPPRANTATDQYYLQLAQQHQAALQSPTPQIVLQPCTQIVQQQNTSSSSTPATTSSTVVPQPVTLVQQIVTPSGEVQQMPIQLSQAQLNMIRLQMQSNPNQPILIQAAQPQQSPQIIQVTPQTQQATQQLFLAQVATTQEES